MISKKKFLQIIKDLNLKNSQYDLFQIIILFLRFFIYYKMSKVFKKEKEILIYARCCVFFKTFFL